MFSNYDMQILYELNGWTSRDHPTWDGFPAARFAPLARSMSRCTNTLRVLRFNIGALQQSLQKLASDGVTFDENSALTDALAPLRLAQRTASVLVTDLISVDTEAQSLSGAIERFAKGDIKDAKILKEACEAQQCLSEAKGRMTALLNDANQAARILDAIVTDF